MGLAEARPTYDIKTRRHRTTFDDGPMRPRHTNKHIEAAVAYAETHGWRLVKSQGHRWGTLYCTFSSREGCRVPVYSTPRSPENHAKDIRREVEGCPHASDRGDGR